MRKSFAILAAVALMTIVSLGTSCSKKERQAKKEMPPNHQKMVEEMEKSMEQSKNIVVARVNDTNITMSDLIREMNAIGPGFLKPGQKPTPEISALVRKRAIDNLIFRELAVQEAAKQGMKVDRKTVDTAIKDLKKRLGSEAAYKVYLSRMGIAEGDIGNVIRKGHLFQMIASKEIFAKVKQPDTARVKKIYEKEKNTFVLPERFIADDVFFGGKADTNAKGKAEKVLSGIRADQGDLSKLKPGNFVVRRITVTQNMSPALFNALEKLGPGKVSDVIEEKDGLHILKLDRKEPGRQMTFEEAGNIISRRLAMQAIEKRKEAWEDQLKKKAKIQIILTKGEGIKSVN